MLIRVNVGDSAGRCGGETVLDAGSVGAEVGGKVVEAILEEDLGAKFGGDVVDTRLEEVLGAEVGGDVVLKIEKVLEGLLPRSGSKYRFTWLLDDACGVAALSHSSSSSSSVSKYGCKAAGV